MPALSDRKEIPILAIDPTCLEHPYTDAKSQCGAHGVQKLARERGVGQNQRQELQPHEDADHDLDSHVEEEGAIEKKKTHCISFSGAQIRLIAMKP